MVERAPLKKQDEQYPLLKVDGGGGDGGVHCQPTPTLVTPGWGVTCTPKQSWLVRWPEYISACWMTLILLGISFLVFYTLGMEAYRRQPVLLIKCNESKPASDVFYHQIIPSSLATRSYSYLMLYIEHLSYMAYKYPSLHFHVYFLIDDSTQSGFRVPRHPRLINSLIPISLSNSYPMYKLDANSKREIAEFQRKHYNINVTIIPLSKYMAMTPLKYKWRNIPLAYLAFYARVLSVWQYGGVGMDLCTFNEYFNNRQHIDRRISAILKQHNDGIKPEEYTNALNKIDREEENEFFSMFYGLIHSIFNETRSFFSKSFLLPPFTPEKDSTIKNEPLIRLHRNKRESPTTTSDIKNTEKNPVLLEIINSTDASDVKKNEYQTLASVDVNNNTTRDVAKNDSLNIENIDLGRINKSEARSETFNKSDRPQLVLFYDFTGFSDGMDSSFVALRSDIDQADRENKQTKNDNSDSYLLSLDTEGVFIAASSKYHPFLSRLICAGCQGIPPKFAIQDTILTQCSGGLFKEHAFCDNIYLL